MIKQDFKVREFMLLFFAFLLFPIACFSELVSVIIPCHYKHICLLEELLDSIARQTKLPDEVVISISEIEKVNHKKLARMQSKSYPFSLNILLHRGVKYAGENRNSGCEAAKGAILIFQDADDLPCRQRYEAIIHIFKTTPAKQVIHKWIPAGTKEPFYVIKKIKCYRIPSWEYYTTCQMQHNGNMAIRREVFEQIKWPTSAHFEDTNYNKAIIEKFRQTFYMEADLVIYRNFLSSWINT